MKMTFRNALLICALFISCAATSGCFALFVGAAAGAGGIAWVQGVLEYNFDATVEKVHAASTQALKQLKLPALTDQADTHNAKLTSEYSDGKNVVIQIEAITEKTAKVKIRVGVFGDRLRSDAILSAIRKNI
ncbi:MAG: hypothetical protein A2Z88_09195 [Omnitrophica WOR_2 bacterium GWA2_47_8]|nr:MAG: hypothetical protein A2Z88_09195 [Omnitrophica WOR_2 bacterium GWA2_47_8]